MLGWLSRALKSPFRRAALINRRVLLDLLRPLDGTFLEVGPGDAPLLEQLTGVPVDQKIALDLPAGIARCRQLGYRCLEQDASTEKWALEDEAADVVVSSQCLEHIPDTDHYIAEAHRVLKLGGKFLVSVPNQAALAYIVLMLFTVNPPMNMVSDWYYGLGNPFSSHRYERIPEHKRRGHAHLRLFATRAINDLLRVHGFRVLRNHGGTWGMPLVGRGLARLFPYYGLLTIALAEKVLPSKPVA